MGSDAPRCLRLITVQVAVLAGEYEALEQAQRAAEDICQHFIDQDREPTLEAVLALPLMPGEVLTHADGIAIRGRNPWREVRDLLGCHCGAQDSRHCVCFDDEGRSLS